MTRSLIRTKCASVWHSTRWGASKPSDCEVELPLSSVPEVYCREYFRLENPQISNVVCERLQVLPRVGGGGAALGMALVTNGNWQEKISSYTDTVEAHLDREMDLDPDMLASTLVALKQLKDDATDCENSAKGMRRRLWQRNQELMTESLAMHNLGLLHDAIVQLKYIMDRIVTANYSL